MAILKSAGVKLRVCVDVEKQSLKLRLLSKVGNLPVLKEFKCESGLRCKNGRSRSLSFMRELFEEIP